MDILDKHAAGDFILIGNAFDTWTYCLAQSFEESGSFVDKFMLMVNVLLIRQLHCRFECIVLKLMHHDTVCSFKHFITHYLQKNIYSWCFLKMQDIFIRYKWKSLSWYWAMLLLICNNAIENFTIKQCRLYLILSVWGMIDVFKIMFVNWCATTDDELLQITAYFQLFSIAVYFLGSVNLVCDISDLSSHINFTSFLFYIKNWSQKYRFWNNPCHKNEIFMEHNTNKK